MLDCITINIKQKSIIMEVVNEAFNTVRQLLKSAVPPCTATIDNPEHYEVRSINPEHSKNILFGYVSKHADKSVSAP